MKNTKNHAEKQCFSAFFKSGKREIGIFAAFLLLCAVRFLAYGFVYYPQLDDHIQYRLYSGTPYLEAVKKYGLLGARPLANSADVVFWGRLPLLLDLFLIICLFTVTAFLLRKLFSRHFGTGHLFTAALLLMPLNFEGTYWISASTRIVVGMFFAALSAFLFSDAVRKAKISLLLLSVFCQLCTVGCYEQAFLLSCALDILLIFLEHKKTEKKSRILLWSAIPAMFLCALLYFVFVGFFKGGPLYGDSYALPNIFSVEFFTKHIPHTFSVIFAALPAAFLTLFSGFGRGIKFIFSDRLIFAAILILLACAALFLLLKKKNHEKPNRFPAALIAGLWLCAAPLAVFFLMNEPYYPLRCAVMSTVGGALLLDSVISRFCDKKYAYPAIVTAVSLCFMIASVSELHDFRQTALDDEKVVRTVTGAIPEAEMVGRIGLLGVEESYLESINCRTEDHIVGVTSSDWAMTGAVNAACDCRLTGKVTFVPLHFVTPLAYSWNFAANEISGFDRLFLYDPDAETLTEVFAAATGNGYDIFFENGEKAAEVTVNGNTMTGNRTS